MQNSSKDKRGAVISAIIVVVIVLLLAIVFSFIIMKANMWAITGFFCLYILLLLAVAGGVIVSLVHRLRELKQGEAEEAKKY